MAIHSGPQANQSVVPRPGYAKEQTLNETHTTNGWENCKNPMRNVQICDTVANALVLVYFKNNSFYSVQKTFHCSVTCIYSIHTLPLQYICLCIMYIIRCVKLLCRLHQYSFVPQRGITPLQVSF
jgi:hypothetical protein